MPLAPHTRIRIVQSRHNARVKALRAALARPSAELVGLEGLHLVEEALASGIAVETIFIRAGSEALLDGLPQVALELVPEILSVPDELLRAAVTTETPQALAALAVPPQWRLDELFAGRGGSSQTAPLLLVLAGLQDPGNVGTAIRSAEAFGATGVLALPGTVSAWNAKSLRASMGSAFRLPMVALSEDAAWEALAQHGIRSLAAVAPGHPRAEPLGKVNLRGSVAFWIGNEGSGLAAATVGRCDGAVTIPCPGPVESLNAATAASVLLYEASRQRTQPTEPPALARHPRSL